MALVRMPIIRIEVRTGRKLCEEKIVTVIRLFLLLSVEPAESKCRVTVLTGVHTYHRIIIISELREFLGGGKLKRIE